MGKKLYVGNLSYSVDGPQLEEMFGQFGQVVSAQIINDRDTGRSKGFGFVEMSSDEEAQAAIAGLNGQEHGGRWYLKKLRHAAAMPFQSRVCQISDTIRPVTPSRRNEKKRAASE